MELPSKFVRKRAAPVAGLFLIVFVCLGADNDARFNDLGHRMVCVCSCNQILLECNHVGCQYSTRMRNELAAAIERGDNDDLTLQAMVQTYGPTVIAAPTTTGFNRIAWIMPYLVLGLGLTAAAFIARSWTKGSGWGTPGGTAGANPTGGADLDEFREQARKETDL